MKGHPARRRYQYTDRNVSICLRPSVGMADPAASAEGAGRTYSPAQRPTPRHRVHRDDRQHDMHVPSEEATRPVHVSSALKSPSVHYKALQNTSQDWHSTGSAATSVRAISWRGTGLKKSLKQAHIILCKKQGSTRGVLDSKPARARRPSQEDTQESLLRISFCAIWSRRPRNTGWKYLAERLRGLPHR